MKKLMMMAVMLMAAVCASAQSDKEPVNAYFTTDEMPDMIKWCPAPPDTIGPAFAYDIMQYFWGKQMRNDKERADIAIRDAAYARLHTSERFLEQMRLARQEFRVKAGLATIVEMKAYKKAAAKRAKRK